MIRAWVYICLVYLIFINLSCGGGDGGITTQPSAGTTTSVSGGAGGSTSSSSSTSKTLSLDAFIASLAKENLINYEEISNPVAYIPSVCWVNTYPEKSSPCFQCHLQPGNKAENIVAYYNPCYSCHTTGKEPNYLDDSALQMVYAFPYGYNKNPWSNLFKDRTEAINNIADQDILNYIKQNNYTDKDNQIILTKTLPSDWPGYSPDCYFNFDDEGFDINPNTKQYTGWRAFRYYPFPGFFPTNGSMDDVIIRLPIEFRVDESGSFNKEIYKANLAIVEAMIKQRDVTTEPIDETIINLDLDKDGYFKTATQVKFTWKDDISSMSYVGKAGALQKQGKLNMAGGLYPIGTEFLHSVRYIDWDETKNEPKPSNRMKELRYGKKIWWADYNYLSSFFSKKGKELVEFFGEIIPESFVGNYKIGFETGNGWVYQGFIEDKKGNLRPQTNEETLSCMGCHSFLGATTDTTFSFPRKLEGSDKNDVQYGWGHWLQKGLKGVKEPVIEYKGYGPHNEYSLYLRKVKSADDFRMNDEVISNFFTPLGFRKPEMLALLKDDISVLLFPSKERALKLNKAYWTIVKEQSYIKGKDPNVKSATDAHVFVEIEEDKPTAMPYKTIGLDPK